MSKWVQRHLENHQRAMRDVPPRLMLKNFELMLSGLSLPKVRGRSERKRSRSGQRKGNHMFESQESIRMLRGSTLIKDEGDDLEKLCEDLENYEKEFSKVIKEGKDEFDRHLTRQIDQTTERHRESSHRA